MFSTKSLTVARSESMVILPCATEQIGQFGFGGLRLSELRARIPERSRKTYRTELEQLKKKDIRNAYHFGMSEVIFENFECLQNTKTSGHGIRSCDRGDDITGHFWEVSVREQRLRRCYPRLVSNLDLGSMPKMVARKLAVAVTKSSVSTSSLSNSRIGFTSLLEVSWSVFNRLLRRSKLYHVSCCCINQSCKLTCL